MDVLGTQGTIKIAVAYVRKADGQAKSQDAMTS